MKVVLISGHDAEAHRRTGFHFWKDILSQRGHEVRFLTVGLSALTLLQKNKSRKSPPYNRWVALGERIKKFTWVPVFHPMYVRGASLSRALGPLFRMYPSLLPSAVIQEVRDASLFIVENGAGPLLVPKLKSSCPHAIFVYNASDRLTVLSFHPVVVEGNTQALQFFDLIRCNAQALIKDFSSNPRAVRYIPQGIDKASFDMRHPNPYVGPRNAVSVGDMLFDSDTVELLASQFSEWTFHLFGRRAKTNGRHRNVIEYGETAFESVVPYIQHADLGIAPYIPSQDADYLSQSSLKMVQYTYCQLPVIAPHFAVGARKNVMGYDPFVPGDAVRAFHKAEGYRRDSINKWESLGWDEVIDRIIDVSNEVRRSSHES